MTDLLPATAGNAARFRRILDATFDAIFVVDPIDLRTEYVNRRLADQLGTPSADLVGGSPASFIVDMDEPRFRQLTDRLGGDGRRRQIGLSFLRRDGSTFPVEVLFERIAFEEREVPRIVATARDVSDRVATEARLQRLAEAEHARAAELNAVIRALGDAVLVCAPDGRIRIANPAALTLVPDVGSYADLVARLEDPRGVAPRLGTASGPVELRLTTENERWLEVSTYPVAPTRADVGRPDARRDGARRDDAQRDQAQRDHPQPSDPETIVLLRDVTVARRAQQSRETFVHMLSHELRTPVTTIFGAAKVLARRDGWLDDETRRGLLVDIEAEAERLHRLVEDVIALTRFGEDEGEVRAEPLLLQRILPGIVHSEEDRWPAVEFTIRMADNLPTVMADRTYVEQVVRNLLSNAAKYAGPQARVELVTAAQDDTAVVRVLDNGPGFGVDEGRRLFDLYYRSPATAASAAGAGIGLFVSARLIEAMGGRIWARPRPEGGAEFGFSLVALPDDE